MAGLANIAGSGPAGRQAILRNDHVFTNAGRLIREYAEQVNDNDSASCGVVLVIAVICMNLCRGDPAPQLRALDVVRVLDLLELMLAKIENPIVRTITIMALD